MLIQPIIENAIKHGLEHKRGEAFITVNFSSENTILTCTVTDNGIGREQSEQRNKSKSYKSVSSSIIKERIQALSIIYNIQLHYATSDLYSEDGKPAGTLVSIQMPIGIKTMSDHFQN